MSGISFDSNGVSMDRSFKTNEVVAEPVNYKYDDW